MEINALLLAITLWAVLMGISLNRYSERVIKKQDEVIESPEKLVEQYKKVVDSLIEDVNILRMSAFKAIKEKEEYKKEVEYLHTALANSLPKKIDNKMKKVFSDNK